jgi:hypothetical protein
MWFAGSVGAVVAVWRLARERRLPPLAGLSVVWGAAAALVIIVNGARLFNTYFINALPPLALLSAYLLSEFPRGSRKRLAIAGATSVMMAVLLIGRHYPERVFGMAADDFKALRGTLDRTRYLEQFGGYGNNRGYSARANEELATYIRAHTAPDDRIFLFGINGAGVYFGSDRLTAHRFLRVNFFVATEFPNPDFRLERVTHQLAERRPRYIIFELLHSASEMGKTADRLPDDPLVASLLGDYHLETRIEDFSLYRLND